MPRGSVDTSKLRDDAIKIRDRTLNQLHVVMLNLAAKAEELHPIHKANNEAVVGLGGQPVFLDDLTPDSVDV
jgi:hypothetical protein